jgi:hypothetical protein
MTPGADAAGCSRRTARSAALGAAARGPDGPVASECRGEEDVLEDSKETQAEEPEEAARRGHWQLCHCSDQCSGELLEVRPTGSKSQSAPCRLG